MITIKAYTDISQSKTLSKILPLESADGGWYGTDNPLAANTEYWLYTKYTEKAALPAWSLAALLGVLPNMISRYFKILGWCYSEWDCAYMDEDGEIKYNSIADNPVDACYDLILKLHELKML